MTASPQTLHGGGARRFETNGSSFQFIFGLVLTFWSYVFMRDRSGRSPRKLLMFNDHFVYNSICIISNIVLFLPEPLLEACLNLEANLQISRIFRYTCSIVYLRETSEKDAMRFKIKKGAPAAMLPERLTRGDSSGEETASSERSIEGIAATRSSPCVRDRLYDGDAHLLQPTVRSLRQFT